MIRAYHMESGSLDFSFNSTCLLLQLWNQAVKDKNEVSCSQPEAVLSLQWHLTMFGMLLVVSRIQWPESQGCCQTPYRALDNSSQRKNCLAPSANSTEAEEPTLRCAFIMVCFLSQLTLWNLTSVNTGPSYTLGYTWIWSPCHIIFTQSLNETERRLPESSIRSLPE